MKIAVFTFTRDRLGFTQQCFEQLHRMAGYPFDHFVLDNGSQDGTADWLKANWDKFHTLIFEPENKGISIASNRMLNLLLRYDYDLILKMDNDCWIQTPDLLLSFARMYFYDEAKQWTLSPAVDNETWTGKRLSYTEVSGWRVGCPENIGGLCQFTPSQQYREFMAAGGFDVSLPMACGQDEQFYAWLKAHGYRIGYVEDLKVSHYLTAKVQAKVYPEYHRRQWTVERKKAYGEF